MKKSTDYYVYVHKKTTNGEVFYVGKGTGRRAKVTYKRSQHWNNVVNKHGLIVEILFDNLTECESFQVEIDTILELKYFGYNLVNITIGGEGGSGERHTDESKERISIAGKGRIVTQETRSKISSKLKGIPLSKKTKDKLRIAHLGFKHTEESKIKISLGRIGMRFSEESKYKMSIAKNSRKVKCSNGMEFYGISKAAEWLKSIGHGKAAPSNIAHSCNNLGKIAYGFTWTYIDK